MIFYSRNSAKLDYISDCNVEKISVQGESDKKGVLKYYMKFLEKKEEEE